VANAAGIFDDRGLGAAASGACSVNFVRSNTLFKIINDKTKSGCRIVKDGRAGSSLFHLPAISVQSPSLSKNLDDIASRDRRSANIIHHFE
jgi:hypothetical protein